MQINPPAEKEKFILTVVRPYVLSKLRPILSYHSGKKESEIDEAVQISGHLNLAGKLDAIGAELDSNFGLPKTFNIRDVEVCNTVSDLIDLVIVQFTGNSKTIK